MKGLNLLLTEDCNLQCKYCFEGLDKRKKTMDFETAKKSIDMLISDKENNKILNKSIYYNIAFFGGEPLLNFKLMKEILKYTKSLEIKGEREFLFSITTNGTIMNKEIFEFLVENKVGVLLSIDGSKKTHNLNRITKSGSGSYNLIEKNMHYFLDYQNILKNSIQVRHTATKETVKYLYMDIKSLFDLGFKKVNFDLDITENWTDIEGRELEHELNKLAKYYKEIIIQNDKKDIFVFNQTMKRIIKPNTKSYCGAGTVMYTIDADGNKYLCARLLEKKYRIGDVHNIQNAQHISNNLIYDYNQHECKDCDLFGVCYKCIALNENNTGSFYRVNGLFCFYQRTIINLMRKILDELYLENSDFFRKKFVENKEHAI
ncbi:radical SAM/SPASM domain-containing protein [Senegalia massiliensis]|uniref:4Fe-4S cluster-binding domain-containing protein n=1 Tax=Senegalia massiliensis TaxID=1720316 RepID=A0A845QZ52_9CLOT|nr:radical SAM protein [Senegalia massiliensis]NBI06442.1 4Fe-4S cluster-binding domain-containing protein [Senegalia massiliensis]